MRIIATPDSAINHIDRAIWLTMPFDRVWRTLAHLIIGDHENGGMTTGDSVVGKLRVANQISGRLASGNQSSGNLIITDDLAYKLEVG